MAKFNNFDYSLDTTTCSYPISAISGAANDSMTVIGYVEPAMEGATVAFKCPTQYVLIGPNTTTCMGNGEWEPDPREVECKGILLKSLATSK